MFRALVVMGAASFLLVVGAPRAHAWEGDGALFDQQLLGYEEAFTAPADAKALNAVKKARARIAAAGADTAALARAMPRILRGLRPAVARDESVDDLIGAMLNRLARGAEAELNGLYVGIQALPEGPSRTRANKMYRAAARLTGAYRTNARAAAALSKLMTKGRAAQALIAIDAPATSWFQDADFDAWGNADHRVLAPGQPINFVVQDGDCNDEDALVNPGELDDADGDDNDCDELVDEDA